MTSASSNPQTLSEIRLFCAEEATVTSVPDDAINDQLSFLVDLIQHYEALTGWELSFAESRRSYRNRQTANRESVVEGDLKITDLSDRLPPGQAVRHRNSCEELAKTINEIVRQLQSQRRLVTEVDQQLQSVLDPPYDWWGLAGKTGFCDGKMNRWVVAPDESIRIFGGQIATSGAVESAICCASLLSAFETACHSGQKLQEFAPYVPYLLSNTATEFAKVDWFASVAIDTITGEFHIDGYEAQKGTTLLDLQAGALIDSIAEEGSGVLYTGQALAMGLDEQQRKELKEIMGNTEMNSVELGRLLDRRFADSASLVLYRK